MLRAVILPTIGILCFLSNLSESVAQNSTYVIRGDIKNSDRPNDPVDGVTVRIDLWDRSGNPSNIGGIVTTEKYAGSNAVMTKYYQNDIGFNRYWRGKAEVLASHDYLRQVNSAKIMLGNQSDIVSNITLKAAKNIAEIKYEKGISILNSGDKTIERLVMSMAFIDDAILYRPNLERALVARAVAMEGLIDIGAPVGLLGNNFIYEYFASNDRKLKSLFDSDATIVAKNIHRRYAQTYYKPNLFNKNVDGESKIIDYFMFHSNRYFEYVGESKFNKEDIEEITHMYQLKYSAEAEIEEYRAQVGTIKMFFESFPDYQNGRVIRAFLADWLTGMERLFGRVEPSDEFVKLITTDAGLYGIWSSFNSALRKHRDQFRWGKSTKSENLRRAYAASEKIVGEFDALQ